MAYDFSKIKVLIVEGNQPMAAIIRGILNTFGVKMIDISPNGEEGFLKFREEKHDLIIADWMMKPVSGIELVKRIRQSDISPNPYVPIIMMTGYADKPRAQQVRDSGVTEFLIKPFTAHDLYRRIAQIIERPRQFVKNDDFFGPDRRRRLSESFNGPDRREKDEDKE